MLASHSFCSLGWSPTCSAAQAGLQLTLQSRLVSDLPWLAMNTLWGLASLELSPKHLPRYLTGCIAATPGLVIRFLSVLFLWQQPPVPVECCSFGLPGRCEGWPVRPVVFVTVYAVSGTLSMLFRFLFEITDFCDRVSLYSSGWWWACSSGSASPLLAQLAGMCLLDWLSIKAFLTCGSWALHHVANISLWLILPPHPALGWT